MPICPKCEHAWEEQEVELVPVEEPVKTEQDIPADGPMLFEQADLGKPRIDREAGILRHVHVLGPVSNHGYSYTADAIQAAHTKFEGMRVGINHDYKNNPLKVEDSWGTLSNPTCDADGIWADLSYLKSHTLTEQILEDIERDTHIFGLSSVNAYPRAYEGKKEVGAFMPVRVDVVAGAATTKTFFESA